ncbi:MAG TPA: TetR family transcriptional regulator [Nocardioidaceae bacterium]|nr:TetR family transcriptional regulator [Nocardioidaceae bacterium]
MGRMSADERRELLVQAAIRVMTRDGVANATTRAIVAEADMPLGVFHYCFRSKEELIEQVMAAINEGTFDAVLPALTGNESFEEIVSGGLRAYWAHVVRDPQPHQLTYELTQYALRNAPDAAHKQYDLYYDLTSKFLAATGEIAQHDWKVPVERLARYLLSVIEGVTFQWLVDGDADAGLDVLLLFGRSLSGFAIPRS